MLEQIKHDFKQGKQNHFRAVDGLTDGQVKWLIEQAEKTEKLQVLAESQARVLDGFISDMEELRERLDNVRDCVKVANETVRLDDHNEALYEAIVSLNYIIDYMLEDFDKSFKQ